MLVSFWLSSRWAQLGVRGDGLGCSAAGEAVQQPWVAIPHSPPMSSYSVMVRPQGARGPTRSSCPAAPEPGSLLGGGRVVGHPGSARGEKVQLLPQRLVSLPPSGPAPGGRLSRGRRTGRGGLSRERAEGRDLALCVRSMPTGSLLCGLSAFSSHFPVC